MAEKRKRKQTQVKIKVELLNKLFSPEEEIIIPTGWYREEVLPRTAKVLSNQIGVSSPELLDSKDQPKKESILDKVNSEEVEFRG